MSIDLITQPCSIFNQIDKNGDIQESPIIITFCGSFITLQHPDSDNHVAINREFIKPLFNAIKEGQTKSSQHYSTVEEHYKQKFEIEKAKVDKNKNSGAK